MAHRHADDDSRRVSGRFSTQFPGAPALPPPTPRLSQLWQPKPSSSRNTEPQTTRPTHILMAPRCRPGTAPKHKSPHSDAGHHTTTASGLLTNLVYCAANPPYHHHSPHHPPAPHRHHHQHNHVLRRCLRKSLPPSTKSTPVRHRKPLSPLPPPPSLSLSLSLFLPSEKSRLLLLLLLLLLLYFPLLSVFCACFLLLSWPCAASLAFCSVCFV